MTTEMIFRTKIDTTISQSKIATSDTIVSIGSCFAENIGKKLSNGMLQSYTNPYGTAYNPASINKQILRIINLEPCSKDEIISEGNHCVSTQTHSIIQAPNADLLAKIIDNKTKEAHNILSKAKYIIITLGTSWIYKLNTNNTIVANCHKLPSSYFKRERLSFDEISNILINTIEKLRQFNPNINIIFTISPIRHLKDTAHGNQLSKAELLLAIDKIKKTNNIDYFPAYEIMMDELRDYRFYADDMIHPSDVAIDYIFEQFSKSYISDDCKKFISEGQKITSALQHRPIGDIKQYYQFIESTLLKAQKLSQTYNVGDDNINLKKAILTLTKIISSMNQTNKLPENCNQDNCQFFELTKEISIFTDDKKAIINNTLYI